MPLIAWSVLAYSASLIVAFSLGDASRVAFAAISLSVTIACVHARQKTRSLVVSVAAIGVMVAIASDATTARCGARLSHASSWTATADADIRAPMFARVNLEGSGCRAMSGVFFMRGTARAGRTILVHGESQSGAGGLFVANAEVSETGSGALLPALRAAVGRRIDRLFTADAPLVRALVIADMSGIPAEMRDRYARSGLVHMLSVSGLHVGVVALALELLASVCRFPKVPSRVATVVLLGIYVAAIGAPPPAVRAAVMLSAVLLTRILQRPTSPWAVLALGALTPLWDPRTSLDLGWQLSVAGTAALIAGGALAQRIMPKGWRSFKRAVLTALTVSVVATLVTAPPCAWTFGRVSLLGPITNLIADPIMGLLQPLLFLAIAIPIGPVEKYLADAGHALILAFDGVARAGASIPGASPYAMPTRFAAVCAAVASVALIRACIAKEWGAPVIVGALALSLMLVEPLLPIVSGAAELHMIDVGQGDALAIRSSRGRWIIVDAGRTWNGGDAGTSVVAPYIARRGGDVEAFFISHPHADHVGGAASVIRMLHPKLFIDPGYVGTTPPYLAALQSVMNTRTPWQRIHPGDSLVVDDVVVSELAPDSTWAATLKDANLASSVFSVRIGGSRILFTGDAEDAEEEWLLAHAPPELLAADVLKVAHHGSLTSSTPAFLDAVHPRVALISVGAHNTYGHPDQEVTESLAGRKILTLRTDQLGTVVLTFANGHIDAEARGQRWHVR